MTRKDIFLLSETAFGIINENTKSGPPYIKISKYGDKYYFKDKAMKILHREDGPAVESFKGFKEWWLNGERHREDGPAVEWPSGDKMWYLNNKIHREDGPACEWHNGDREWYLNNYHHREDGPAIERVNGKNSWFLNGVEFSEKEFKAHHAAKQFKQDVEDVGDEAANTNFDIFQ
jgi:hypothetical protein